MTKTSRLLIVLILMMVPIQNCLGNPNFTDDQAIRAVVGEAAGEGYPGMYAVACALRNRGTLKGVYGLNAKHVKNEPAWVWQQASKALAQSEDGPDVTNGGTHWENIKTFGKPKWANSMTETARHGRHVFYKEAK